MLLLNEGELLFSGAPQELTRRMAGRTVLIAAPRQPSIAAAAGDLPAGGHRRGDPGKYLRLILKEGEDHRQLLQALDLPDAELDEADPRFEDAFIDLLGGG